MSNRPWKWTNRKRDPRRPVPIEKRYRLGTVTSARERQAVVQADDGERLTVIVPANLFCWASNRVALARYPDGWVVVGRLVGGGPSVLSRPGPSRG